jgi:hypothetical protein
MTVDLLYYFGLMADSEAWSDSVTPFTTFLGCLGEITQASDPLPSFF